MTFTTGNSSHRPAGLTSALRPLGFAVLSATAMLPALAQADILGLSAGVSAWYTGADGDIKSGGDNLGLDNQLGLDDEFSGQIFAMFENPIPLIPNVRVQYSSTSLDGDGRVTANVFDRVSLDGATSTSFDVDQADAIVFWELLDTVVHIDFGLQVKFVDGSIKISEKRPLGNTAEQDFSVVLPMLYGGVGLNLPLTGLSIYGSVAGIGYAGNSIVDANLALTYEVNIVDVALGWREEQIELDDVDDTDADFTLGGPYIGVGLSF